MSTPGTLFLVVGPSGVGKDSLIQAFQATAPEIFVFPQRYVTRPRVDDSEDFIPVEYTEFREEDYWLSWEAHGLFYGLPKSIDHDLAAGRHVMLNTSRKMIGMIENKHSDVVVISIVARLEIIAERLLGRGRETPEEIVGRMSRIAPLYVSTAKLIEIDNSGSLDTALAAFRGAVQAKAD